MDLDILKNAEWLFNAKPVKQLQGTEFENKRNEYYLHEVEIKEKA